MNFNIEVDDILVDVDYVEDGNLVYGNVIKVFPKDVEVVNDRVQNIIIDVGKIN